MAKNDNTAQRGMTIVVLIAMVLGVLIGLMFGRTFGLQEKTLTLQSKVGEVMSLVEDEYVDSLDADSLSERLIAVMLAELDPHSSYLSARETERTDEMMRGSFEGVGLVIHHEGDSTYVGQVLPDGPSARSGLLPGDLIVSIDGRRVCGVGLPSDSVVAMLRGPRSTKVELGILRQCTPTGAAEPRTFTIRRNTVPHHTVLHYTMLDDTTGYILLGSFASTSYDEFHDALYILKQNGMRHLVFDLRGNGGGSLSAAVGIAGELLPHGSLIVYTQGAHSRRRDVRARGNGLFSEGRVTVLVDENSASASEVVSGALQDNDRATIVGRRTFGKGLVQTDFALADGSSVLLTTARYYTPSGRCIQRPYDGGTGQYYREYFNQLLEETYADSATVHIKDTTPYYTVGGRIVYGGGGIIPDRLLPVRKDSSFVYYNQLAGRGLINRVAFGYVRQHAARLVDRYPDAPSFVRGFQVDNALVERLVAAGEAEGIGRNSASLRVQRPLIEAMLKAYIGQSLFGNQGFYDSYLPQDEDLKAVIKNKI